MCMLILILYCAFCYLYRIGFAVSIKKIEILPLIFAPVFVPFETGVIIAGIVKRFLL